MSKHTEGEWEAYFPEEVGEPIQIKLGDIESGVGYPSHCLIEYAECFARYSRQQKEEARANTKLIASAPELLEAAKEMFECVDYRAFDDNANEYDRKKRKWHRTILKAEGDIDE